jgi:TatA/E family protein of Tat protein translocase
MPFNIGPVELIFVLVIALLVLGPGKLPEVGSALGKSIREFRKAATDIQDSARVDAPAATPAPPAAATPTPAPQVDQPAVVPTTTVQPNTLSGQSAPNEIGGERQA